VNHVLARVYNRAYDFFIFKYFKENGIDITERGPFEQVEDIALDFQNEVAATNGQRPSRQLSSEFRLQLPEPRRVFHDYAKSWKMEPGPKPSVIYFLERTLQNGRRLDATLLGELAAELPSGRGKLLFTDSEAAADFGKFWRSYLVYPMGRDMKKSEPKRLLKYFTIDEMKGLPDNRVVSAAEFDEAIRKEAFQVQSKLARMTPDVFLQNIELVIAKHWDGPNHPRLGGNSSEYESCQHTTECVDLFCTRSKTDGSEQLALKPARGFLIWVKHKWAPEYADLKFPRYNVYKET